MEAIQSPAKCAWPTLVLHVIIVLCVLAALTSKAWMLSCEIDSHKFGECIDIMLGLGILEVQTRYDIT